MLELILFLLRIRTLLTLGIVYCLLSAATHGNLSLNIPNFNKMSFTNITKASKEASDKIHGWIQSLMSNKKPSKKQTEK